LKHACSDLRAQLQCDLPECILVASPYLAEMILSLARMLAVRHLALFVGHRYVAGTYTHTHTHTHTHTISLARFIHFWVRFGLLGTRDWSELAPVDQFMLSLYLRCSAAAESRDAPVYLTESQIASRFCSRADGCD